MMRKSLILAFALPFSGTAMAAPSNFETSPGAIFGPPDRSVIVSDATTAELDVSTKDSELTLSHGRKIATIKSDPAADTFRNLSYGISLSVPLGGNDDLTDKATLNSLSNGVSLSGSLSLYSSNPMVDLDSAEFNRVMEIARRNCAAATDDDDANAKRSCLQRRNERQFAVVHSGESEARINRMVYSGAWQISVKGSVGMNDFEFRNPNTLAELSDNKPQFAISGSATIFPSDAMSSWTLESEYQNAFEAVDDQVLCPVVITDSTKDCVFAAPSGPKNVESLVFRLEHRRVFVPNWSLGELAIAPQISYDALGDEFGAELPIYLIMGEKSPISPGVKIGYASKDDEFIFGVFLKTAFSF